MSNIQTITIPADVWEQMTERLRLFGEFIYWRKRSAGGKEAVWELVCAAYDMPPIGIVQPPYRGDKWKSDNCKLFDSRDKAMRATEAYHRLPRCRVEGEP